MARISNPFATGNINLNAAIVSQTVTDPFTIAAGAVQIYIYNNGAANGDFNGIAIPPGIPLNFENGGKTFKQYSGDGTGTSLLIHVTY